MMRWLLRLGIVGALAAAAYWLWTQLNQDLEDEDLDEEIPIEFDVPLDAAIAPTNIDADTGVGPGADLRPQDEAPTTAQETHIGESAEDAGGEQPSNDAVGNGQQPAQSAGKRLRDINGIGPVTESRLIEAGITSITDLASSSPERLHELGFITTQAEAWTRQAREQG